MFTRNHSNDDNDIFVFIVSLQLAMKLMHITLTLAGRKSLMENTVWQKYLALFTDSVSMEAQISHVITRLTALMLLMRLDVDVSGFYFIFHRATWVNTTDSYNVIEISGLHTTGFCVRNGWSYRLTDQFVPWGMLVYFGQSNDHQCTLS